MVSSWVVPRLDGVVGTVVSSTRSSGQGRWRYAHGFRDEPCIKPRFLWLQHEYLRLLTQEPAITEMVLHLDLGAHL